MSLRSSNSVNSVQLNNLQIIIKMLITITMILTGNLTCKKGCRSLLKKRFRKEAPKSSYSQDKTACQNSKVLLTAFAKLIPVVLISTKFINQNLSKANDEVF